MKNWLPLILLCGVVIFQIMSPNMIFPPERPSDYNGRPTGEWYPDAEVTFTGKFASRAADFLDWTIAFPYWSTLDTGEKDNPFQNAHVVIRNIVIVLLLLTFIVTAFIIILTRSQNISAVKFVPRFILVTVLVLISFSTVMFIYQITDIIQIFFLWNPEKQAWIKSSDLLDIGFSYEFTGFRKHGIMFDESAFITLWLTKLTAITYFVMSSILIFRKILMWFFIVLVPVFPILLLYSPIRNTAKIWLGEFVKWVLYAPLFAILLFALVSIWKFSYTTNGALPGVPLGFVDFNCAINEEHDLPASSKEASKDTPVKDPSKPNPCRVYPTSINILLGGPKGFVSDPSTDPNQRVQYSLNTRGNFAIYWVALLMLWAAIILPWVLLKIFFDYANNLNFSGENGLVNYFRQGAAPLLNRYGLNTPPKSPPPSGIAPKGMAMELPHSAGDARQMEDEDRSSIVSSIERTIAANEQALSSRDSLASNSISSSSIRSVNQPVFSSTSNNVNDYNLVKTEESQQILQLTNLSIPTMVDIANYETQILSSSTTQNYQINNQLNQINENLRRISNTSPIVTPIEREKYTKVKEIITTSAQTGNPVAQTILNASQSTEAAIPQINKVQQVSFEDYEVVKKMWKENFNKMAPPKDADGREINRSEWIKQENKKIEEAVNMLVSSDPQKQKQGKELVGKILPFLLLGGFSQAEIIAYLKAKQAAAKEVTEELNKKKDEDDTLMDRNTKSEHAQKHMEAAAELPTETGTKKEDSQS